MTRHQQSGVTLIFVVLLLGTVALTASVVLLRVGIDHVSADIDRRDAHIARQGVYSCMEEMLIWFNVDTDYSESSIYTEVATCSVSITSPTADTRDAAITVMEGDVEYGIVANFDIDPVAVNSIQESL